MYCAGNYCHRCKKELKSYEVEYCNECYLTPPSDYSSTWKMIASDVRNRKTRPKETPKAAKKRAKQERLAKIVKEVESKKEIEWAEEQKRATSELKACEDAMDKYRDSLSDRRYQKREPEIPIELPEVTKDMVTCQIWHQSVKRAKALNDPESIFLDTEFMLHMLPEEGEDCYDSRSEAYWFKQMEKELEDEEIK